jgi:very-short-patch-repair endonuclease
MSEASAASASVLRDRLLQVLAYLDDIVSRSETPTRSLPGDRTVRGSALPEGLPGCELYPGEAWLRLVKVPDPPSVPVPPLLADLLHPVRHDPANEPPLNAGWPAQAERAGIPVEQVSQEHQDWLEQTWRPWAARTLEARRVTRAYTSVRGLALELERQESDLELVWGHGLLQGRVDGDLLDYPLLATPIEVVVEPDTGVLAVRPTGPTRLELSALAGLPSQHLDDLLAMVGPGAVVGLDPLDDEARREFFAHALMNLGGQPRVHQPEAGPVDPTWQSELWIDDTLAITLRQRFSNLRGFLADLRAHATEQGGALDFTGLGAMSAILHDEPSTIDDPSDPSDSWHGSGTRLLMPLETNEDQEKIARELAAKKLVAVQGPPGTGKTHTIANLISHLVAHGKRVLVVAHKEEPLTEVRDKIPASLRDLSVALMGNSATQVNQMQAAVRHLMAVGSVTEAPAAELRVAQIAAELDAASTRRGRIEAALRQVSARDREMLELGGISMRPLQVGDWLAEHRNDGWLDDDFAHGTACPLSSPELDELLRLGRSTTGRDRAEALKPLPALDPLRSGTVLDRLHQRLDELEDLENSLVERGLKRSAGQVDGETLQALAERCGALLTSMGQRSAWLVHLGASAANLATRDSIDARLTALQTDLDDVARRSVPLAGHAIQIDPEQLTSPRDHLLILEKLKTALNKGGVGMFSARDVRRAQKQNQVDGEDLRSAADADLVIDEIKLEQARQRLKLGWDQLAAQHAGPPTTTAYPEHEVTANLEALNRCVEEETETWPQLRADLTAMLTDVPVGSDQHWLTRCTGLLKEALALPELQRLRTTVQGMVRTLDQGAAQPRASILWTALRDALVSRRWAEWDALLAEVSRLRELRAGAARCRDLAAALSDVAPRTTAAILRDEVGRRTAADVMNAWRWHDTRAWLNDVIGSEDTPALGEAAHLIRADIRRLIEELAEASARYALIVGMTDRQRRALSDWSTAIGKIGKGTGKSAGHWTAVAQQRMQDAVEGVPVWIMSWQRALTQFRGGTTPFDVVIVDEASQCDIRSLLVLTLARRAVVVGDDKQISPTSFVSVDVVRDLIDRHLKNVPSAHFYEPNESLFNRASGAANGALTLSEHFRCVPEIITFCSQRWYDGRIQPLRAGAGAFAEPFQVTHTPEGIRQSLTGYGNDVNQAEADALIEKVVELSEDEAYQDKTFGVISLLSSSKQDVYLQHRLLARLGEREFAHRQIKVGGSYTFQGAERDVMFISLVVDSTKRFGAFTSLDDERRVNVAASRARDQVWIFHSAEIQDFNKGDIRRAWLEYANSGFHAQQQFDNLEDLCESAFEKDVLRQLVGHGYTPVPQFQIGKYRIDFVIQLKDGSRIAIECDGDQYHQDLDADATRRAILTRVGRCEFFSVRGSVYGSDPIGSLQPLWTLLEERNAPRWQNEERDTPGRQVGDRDDESSAREPISATDNNDTGTGSGAVSGSTATANSDTDSASGPTAGSGADSASGPTAGSGADSASGASAGSDVGTLELEATATSSASAAGPPSLTSDQQAVLQLALQSGASLRLAPDGSIEIIPAAGRDPQPL